MPQKRGWNLSPVFLYRQAEQQFPLKEVWRQGVIFGKLFCALHKFFYCTFVSQLCDGFIGKTMSNCSGGSGFVKKALHLSGCFCDAAFCFGLNS